MIRIICLLLLLAQSLAGASKLTFLYNSWSFDDTVFGINAQPFQIAAPVFEPGLFGNGLRCNKTPSQSGVAIGTGTFAIHQDFTILVWVRPITIDPNYQSILETRTGTSTNGRGFSLMIDPAGFVEFSIKNGFEVWGVISTNQIAVGQWNCIFVGYNQKTLHSFVRLNDGRVDSISAFIPGALSPANLAIGTDANQALPSLDAVLDLLTMWKGFLLTDLQMSQLYNSGTGVNYPFP